MLLSREQFSVVFNDAADIIEQSIIRGRTLVSCYALDEAAYQLLDIISFSEYTPLRDFYAKYMKPINRSSSQHWFGPSEGSTNKTSIRKNQKRRQIALLLMHEMVNSNLEMYYSEYLMDIQNFNRSIS